MRQVNGLALDDGDLALAALAVAPVTVALVHRVTSGFTANEP
jgi:hypothetical protein